MAVDPVRPTPRSAAGTRSHVRTGSGRAQHVDVRTDRHAGRPHAARPRPRSTTSRAWSANGSCCPTSPSPTCCSGCRSRCRPPRRAACRGSCASRSAGPRPGRPPTRATRSACCCAATAIAAAADRATPRAGSSARPTPTGRATCRSVARPSRSRFDGEVDRGARPRRQPGQRAHARASSSWSICRARRTWPAWWPTARSRRPARRLEETTGPRVGDGLVRLEPDGTIIYASPNALSAFNRLGRHRPGAVRADRRADQHRRPTTRSTPATSPARWPTLSTAGSPPPSRSRAAGRSSVPGAAAAPARRDARRAAADAGRHRAAPPGPADPEQGRHHP